MIEFTHYFASHDPSTIPSDQKENLRRSLPNFLNMDPISSHNYGRSAGVFRRSHFTVSRLTHCLNKFLHLRTVKLYQLEHMGDKFLPILNASAMKHTMTHLELHGLRIVKDGHCLDLPGDSRLTHVALKGTLFCTYKVLKSFTTSQNLQVVRLSGCRALLDDDVKDLTKRLERIKVLELNDCSKLYAPEIDCPTLEVLGLERCPMLRDLTKIHCDNLRRTNLSHCSSFGDKDIEKFMKHHTKLEKISFEGCRGFTKIDVRSDCLKEINLGMCMKIQSCNITAGGLTFLELGMCMKLENLYLDLQSIKTLDLSMLTVKNLTILAPKLSTLNVSGCCKLTAMKGFDCPKLMELDICGTNLSLKKLKLGRKTKIKHGGDGTDWSSPFR